MTATEGYPIKVAVRRTGLSPHVIRVWEKRYAAITPQRTPTNRRLYTEADIQRLSLLRRATQSGHSISHIARLANARLHELIAADVPAAVTPVWPGPVDDSSSQSYLETCLAATAGLDATALEAALLRARVALSQPAFIEHLIVPLMEAIGEGWRDGSLRIMHEHLASAVVRSMLGSLQDRAMDTTAGPPMVVTTPVGQWHEIGALIVALTAASQGWATTYLGANLPAEEIAAAAHHKQARAVALSIVYPGDDPRLEPELVKLRRYLAPDMVILVGGRAAEGYRQAVAAIGAQWLQTIPSLRAYLDAVRSGGAARRKAPVCYRSPENRSGLAPRGDNPSTVSHAVTLTKTGKSPLPN